MAILVHKTSNEIMFLLQSRGIALADVGRVKSNPNAPDVKINLSSEIGLQYCPWCGRQLQELIKASQEAFEELAKRHKSFYMGP